MTTMMNEQLERRISEHLDGRLDAANEAELLRELMRDPASRSVRDQWANNDRAAALALRAVVDMPSRPFVIQPHKKRTPLPWAQMLATAALVVLAVGVWAMLDHLNTVEPHTPSVAVMPTPVPISDGQPITTESILADTTEPIGGSRWWRQNPVPVDNGRLTETVASTHVVDQQTVQNTKHQSNRSYLSVIDSEAETVYWLELHQQQTYIHAVGGEM